MIIILKRITNNVRVEDINSFLKPALSGGLLKKAGRIESVKIQQLSVNENNKIEYNALIDILPDSVAQRVIKVMDRKPCYGKPINIAEYFNRHYSNDPRQSVYEAVPNRRKGDRRRKNLTIKDVTSDFIIPVASRTQNTKQGKDINWY